MEKSIGNNHRKIKNTILITKEKYLKQEYSFRNFESICTKIYNEITP
jgi:hypothetical protein